MTDPAENTPPEWVVRFGRQVVVARELVPLTARLLLALLYWVVCVAFAVFLCVALVRGLVFVSTWLDTALTVEASTHE